MKSDHRVSEEKCYYGWIMVFLCALQKFFSGPGQTYSIQSWKPKYIEEFALTESQMGSIYAAGTVVSGCLLFIMGMAIDRFGAKQMTLWVVLPGLISACLVSSYMTNYW